MRERSIYWYCCMSSNFIGSGDANLKLNFHYSLNYITFKIFNWFFLLGCWCPNYRIGSFCGFGQPWTWPTTLWSIPRRQTRRIYPRKFEILMITFNVVHDILHCPPFLKFLTAIFGHKMTCDFQKSFIDILQNSVEFSRNFPYVSHAAWFMKFIARHNGQDWF